MNSYPYNVKPAKRPWTPKRVLVALLLVLTVGAPLACYEHIDRQIERYGNSGAH